MERSNLDTLTISPNNERREEEEEEKEEAPSTPSTPDFWPEGPPWWKPYDKDWSIKETSRIHNEMGRSGKCHFCDFSCEPNLGVAPWYNIPLNDHLEEVHPETEEWFA